MGDNQPQVTPKLDCQAAATQVAQCDRNSLVARNEHKATSCLNTYTYKRTANSRRLGFIKVLKRCL